MAKKKYKPKSFESVGEKFVDSVGKARADTSANIYKSMLQSRAFIALTDRQKILYVCCKAQYYGERKPEKDYSDIEQFAGDDKFYLNWAVIQRYGIYTENSHSNFYKDMSALESHGFIKRISSGKNHRKKTIYQFTDSWKKWKE